jgi:sialate O-acetylesterase
VTLGDGEDDDLHPLGKKEVAEKVSEAVDAIASYPHGYCSGPLALRALTAANKIFILFQTFGKGIVADTGSAVFELEQEGDKFTIDNYEVAGEEIHCAVPIGFDVTKPGTVRYNWSNSPSPFIKDGEGNVAAPFVLTISQ